MLIEDFAKYMNHLTICRPIDKTWTQLVYHQSFAPSYGPVTIKNLDGLLNNQFIFSFNNPLVKKIRVNVKLEQTDVRLADGNVVPPITPNRIKLGLLIIEMSNSLDELFDFDPKMIVSLKLLSHFPKEISAQVSMPKIKSTASSQSPGRKRMLVITLSLFSFNLNKSTSKWAMGKRARSFKRSAPPPTKLHPKL